MIKNRKKQIDINRCSTSEFIFFPFIVILTAILCSNETLFFSWLVDHLPVIINHIYCLRSLNMVLIFEVTQKGTVNSITWLILVGGICSSRFYFIWFSESKCSCKGFFCVKGRCLSNTVYFYTCLSFMYMHVTVLHSVTSCLLPN